MVKPISNSLIAFAALAISQSAYADPKIIAAAELFAERTVSTWLTDPMIVTAIKVQNAQNAGLSQADIDALDKQWRAESKDSQGPLISKLIQNSLSEFLRGVKDEGEGLMTEIFIMDDKGLNVGQSDITSDFWQGDEAKWQKTFSAAPKSMFVDEVEMDESTQRFQTQVSIAITDPDTGKNIGAVTIGVDAENLLMQ
ncbi:MAG: hypothetical protein ACI9UN_002056 [Granulosicoccus sp.]|jgi:hypothetical protein